jgi:hypothetical protein
MSSSSEEDGLNVEVIPMENIPSDGDMSTWPGKNYLERPDFRWRQLLAENWLKAMGSYEEGELSTDISDSRLLQACCLCCTVLFYALHWSRDCVCRFVQLLFAPLILCGLY